MVKQEATLSQEKRGGGGNQHWQSKEWANGLTESR